MNNIITLKFTGERFIPQDRSCGADTEIYKEHITRYEFAKQFLKNNYIILDIACGVGYGTKMLCDSLLCIGYGCDISKESIDYAKKIHHSPNVTFQVMDATNLSFSDNFFDCVICFETLEHIQNYEKAVLEFQRVLKNNGILIISTPNKDVSQKHNSKNEFHEHEFTKTEFLQLLSKYFTYTTLYSQKLIIEPSIQEKILKKLMLISFKITKYDKMNLRRKFIKKGTGTEIYKSIDNSYREPNILQYEENHLPQNFIAVSIKKS